MQKILFNKSLHVTITTSKFYKHFDWTAACYCCLSNQIFFCQLHTANGRIIDRIPCSVLPILINTTICIVKITVCGNASNNDSCHISILTIILNILLHLACLITVIFLQPNHCMIFYHYNVPSFNALISCISIYLHNHFQYTWVWMCQMGLKDVAFLPSRISFYKTLPKKCDRY